MMKLSNSRGCVMSEGVSISELYCPECGYDLRQIQSTRCPECGMEVDRSKLGESVIPWLHRGVLGRRRAFWRTVEMVSLRPGALAREMNRPAFLTDALKFRRAAVLHALLPFGVVLTLVWWGWARRIWLPTDIAGSVLQIVSLVVGWCCLAAMLWGISDSAGYFFRPASLSLTRQNRAVALSYYACAPMAYLPFAAVIMGIALALLASQGRYLHILLRAAIALVGAVPLLGNLILLIVAPVSLCRAVLRSHGGHATLLAIFLPLIWALWGAITLLALPAVWLAVVVMILSLQK
jgi:hypothetical protein